MKNKKKKKKKKKEKKKKSLKENNRIQNIDIEESKGNIIVDRRELQKIWENRIIEIHDRSNRPENLEVGHEEDVDADEEGPYIL